MWPNVLHDDHHLDSKEENNRDWQRLFKEYLKLDAFVWGGSETPTVFDEGKKKRQIDRKRKREERKRDR